MDHILPGPLVGLDLCLYLSRFPTQLLLAQKRQEESMKETVRDARYQRSVSLLADLRYPSLGPLGDVYSQDSPPVLQLEPGWTD